MARDPVVILNECAELIPLPSENEARAMILLGAFRLARGEQMGALRIRLRLASENVGFYGEDGCAALRLAYEELGR